MSDLSRQHELSQDRAIKALRKGKAALRRGVVTAVSPLEVSVGGGSSLPAFAVDGCALSVNDQVSVIQQGSQVVVQGRLTDDPVDAGSVGGPFQPLDSDLTAIAALTTTSFGRALLTQADAAATRGTIGVVIGTDVQAYDSDLAAIAALSTTSFGRSLLTQANAAAALATIGAAASSHTHAQSDITGLTAALALLAPLASPALTGNPTAPTQTAGNNSTRIATTAYADGAVSTASTADRARANHTGTQTASTISDFDTQVRTNRPNQLATPNADWSNGSNKITNVKDATSAQDAVTLAQMQQADVESQAGYTRLADVDSALMGGKQGPSGTPGSLSISFGPGPIVSGTANGLLYTTDRPFDYASLTPVSVGDEILFPDKGIYVITDTGGPSTPFAGTRRSDADTTGDLVQNNLVRSRKSGAQFYLATPDPVVISAIVAQSWLPYKFYPSEHAASHLPGGTDELTTAAAGTIQPDDTAATGSAASFARSDHRHAIACDTPVAVGTANAEGSSTSFARADHVHAPPTPESWINVSGGVGFTGTWTNFGSGYNDAGYYKDPLGVVHLRGLVKSGTIGTGIFTLPSGYRPPNIQVHAVASNAAFGYLDISTAGVVRPLVGNTTWVSLDGITFRV